MGVSDYSEAMNFGKFNQVSVEAGCPNYGKISE